MDKFFDRHNAEIDSSRLRILAENVNKALSEIRLSVLGDEKALQTTPEVRIMSTSSGVETFFNERLSNYLASAQFSILSERSRITDEFRKASSETKRLMKPLFDALQEFQGIDFYVKGGVFHWKENSVKEYIEKKHTVEFPPEVSEYYDMLMKLVCQARVIENFENNNGLIRYARHGLLFRGMVEGTGRMVNIIESDKDLNKEDYLMSDLSKTEEFLKSMFVMGRLGKVGNVTLKS